MMKQGTLPRRALLAGVASAAVLLIAGCGGDGGTAGSEHGGASATSHTSSAPASGSTAFNDTDVAFAQNMIPHHKEAVEMAELAEARANDTELKKLAAQIKTAQEPEIQTLTGWLTAWGKPTEPSGGHGSMAMPGMMSAAEMDKLMAAKGKEFDRLFARSMIAHHNGAVQMAREEQSKGSNAEAKALAATIEKTQAAEVAELEKILDRL